MMRFFLPTICCLALSIMNLSAGGIPEAAAEGETVAIRVIKQDDQLGQLLDPGLSQARVLASGFTWSEGPLWVPELDGLLFSDVPNRTIWLWREGEELTPFVTAREDYGPGLVQPPQGKTFGTNGLVLDNEGRLIVCGHSQGRALFRFDLPGWLQSGREKQTWETLVTEYRGKRLNAPNDAVVHPESGAILFTDPPYGLADKDKQLAFNGVFRFDPAMGEIDLLIQTMSMPNGIGLSPEATMLYVAEADPAQRFWMEFEFLVTGTVANGQQLASANRLPSKKYPGVPDGLKVDAAGNIWASGPGGVLIYSPGGDLLGHILIPATVANLAFGGRGGKTLYLTAHDKVLALPVNVQGSR